MIGLTINYVQAWSAKVVPARLALQVSLYELGPVLSCLRLLESSSNFLGYCSPSIL